jgi:hypothetical protein
MQNGFFRAECGDDDWWEDYPYEPEANGAAYYHNRTVHQVGGGRRKKGTTDESK